MTYPQIIQSVINTKFGFKNFQLEDYTRGALHDGLVLGRDTGGGKSLALFTWPALKVGFQGGQSGSDFGGCVNFIARYFGPDSFKTNAVSTTARGLRSIWNWALLSSTVVSFINRIESLAFLPARKVLTFQCLPGQEGIAIGQRVAGVGV